MPERPGPWELLDRPSDPVVADRAAIDSRLAHFRSLADAMRVEGQRLAKIGSGEALAGKYADELRSASQDVAKDLNQVVGRYDAVVQALVAYQPALDAALAGSAAALDDAIDASGAVRQADALPLATAAAGAELTPQQVQANDDKTAATNAAAGRLQAAKARLAGVLASLDDAGREAAATVRRGFGDGLTDSGWDRFKYAFKKFLKILVQVLTYIGMALAVIAIIIPGVGPLIFAAGAAIGAVALAAEIGLMALGEGSWLDLGMALAGMLTLGGTKLFGPAINSGLRSAMGSLRGTSRAGTSAAEEAGNGVLRLRGGADDAASIRSGTSSVTSRSADDAASVRSSPGSVASRSGDDSAESARSGAARPEPSAPKTDLELAREWGVPPGSTKVPHPDDIGHNAAFIKPGTDSWISPTGVTYTRMTDWVGYKGISTEGAETMLQNGPRRHPDPRFQNGNPDPDWKGFYAADKVEGARPYATEFNEDTFMYSGGDVLRYQHGREVTLVQPGSQVSDGNLARELFPLHDRELPFMDELGKEGMIMRNPLDNEDGFEFIVPWSLSEDGTVTRAGQMIPGKRRGEEATWVELPPVPLRSVDNASSSAPPRGDSPNGSHLDNDAATIPGEEMSRVSLADEMFSILNEQRRYQGNTGVINNANRALDAVSRMGRF